MSHRKTATLDELRARWWTEVRLGFRQSFGPIIVSTLLAAWVLPAVYGLAIAPAIRDTSPVVRFLLGMPYLAYVAILLPVALAMSVPGALRSAGKYPNKQQVEVLMAQQMAREAAKEERAAAIEKAARKSPAIIAIEQDMDERDFDWRADRIKPGYFKERRPRSGYRR